MQKTMDTTPKRIADLSPVEREIWRIAEISDRSLDEIEQSVCEELFKCGELSYVVCPNDLISVILRLRNAEAERDSLRAEVKKLREENEKRLRASEYSRANTISCGENDWYCGLCADCLNATKDQA